jgi:septum formation topological specificity factor MinE
MLDSILQISFIICIKNFLDLIKKWTPIEEKMVKIQIGNNSSKIITRIPLPIQLTNYSYNT